MYVAILFTDMGEEFYRKTSDFCEYLEIFFFNVSIKNLNICLLKTLNHSYNCSYLFNNFIIFSKS